MNSERVRLDPRIDKLLRSMFETDMEFSPEEEDLLTATPQQIEMKCNADGEYVAHALRFYRR